MNDYKYLTNDEPPLSLIDYLGAACFLIAMFLPFSREAWGLLLKISGAA
jgi:hypothetical protein